MSSSTFTLSAFGDEIADDLETQLRVLNELDIGHLELRGVWGKNVLNLTEDDVERVRDLCARHAVAVSAIGSPVGKSPITEPIEKEEENLGRLAEIGRALGTRNIRIFSFYPPDTSSNAGYNRYLDTVAQRLERLVKVAIAEDLLLMLENEKEIVGDTLARCRAILDAVDDPHLTFVWDPANFVQVGEERVTERGWPDLGPRVGYVHIKDCSMDGTVQPAGEGDGQVDLLLRKLKETGYRGYLALEPHLAIAGHSSGFSGPEGMAHAVEKLRALMAAEGCTETH